MRYTPTLQDLRLGRIHIRTAWLTPRKCMLTFAASLIAAATLIRLTWTLSRAYSDLHSSSDTDGELVILPEDACSRGGGAFCLDGSRPGFYFRKGKSESRGHWLIVLPGAAWCWTVEECHAWQSIRALGSTTGIETTRPFSAILSASCHVNPHFCDWTAVLVVSCDGSSFLGNRSETSAYSGARPLHMRGSAVLTAVLDHLAASMGLSDARQVVLYGQSSSALAAVLHVDYARSLLTGAGLSRAAVTAIADGGITLSSAAAAAVHDNRFLDFATLHGINGSRHLHGCEQCTFVDRALRLPASPVVLLASLFDDWSLRLLGPSSELPAAAAAATYGCATTVDASRPRVRGPAAVASTSAPATAEPLQKRRLLRSLDYGRWLLAFVRSLPLDNRCAYVTTCPVSLLSPDAVYAAAANHSPLLRIAGGGGGWPGVRGCSTMVGEDVERALVTLYAACSDGLPP